MAHYEDLELDQGSSARWKLQLLDSDGSIRDLSDYEVRAKLNRSYNADSSEAVSFTALIDPPATNGIINISLTPAQTELLTKRRYVYDVEVEFGRESSRNIERVLEGMIFVSKSVTK